MTDTYLVLTNDRINSKNEMDTYVECLQKVNQALGRLVRAPGQSAKVLLHCRRFADPAYASLLAPEYQLGRHVLEAADLAAWLDAPGPR